MISSILDVLKFALEFCLAPGHGHKLIFFCNSGVEEVYPPFTNALKYLPSHHYLFLLLMFKQHFVLVFHLLHDGLFKILLSHLPPDDILKSLFLLIREKL